MARRLIYRGRVQGVGFRYTTASIARRFSVVGYVKNLRSGAVELVVEGPQDQRDAFLKEIATSFAGNIEGHSAEEFDSAEVYRDFTIRYD